MNYTTFKSIFTNALAEAHLLGPAARPKETIDLENMDRRYSVRLGLDGPQKAEPFTVTCKLGWRWDALQSARVVTTEEDMLTELHGRDEAANMDTERPWLRVDVKLCATFPWGKGSTMPNKSTWKRFLKDVTRKVAPLMPCEEVEFNDGTTVLGWCGEPQAQVRCSEDGTLLLSGVELEAWQPVLLPRQWSDSEREPDDEPELEVLAGRVRAAMTAWGEAVRVLRIVEVGVN